MEEGGDERGGPLLILQFFLVHESIRTLVSHEWLESLSKSFLFFTHFFFSLHLPFRESLKAVGTALFLPPTNTADSRIVELTTFSFFVSPPFPPPLLQMKARFFNRSRWRET